MAVSASALSLAQYAVLSNSPLVQAVTYSLRENGSIMSMLPFVNKKTLFINGLRWVGNLPGVTWGKINSEGTNVIGTPTPFQESAFIVRNEIDVDKIYVQDVNAIVNPRDAQTAAWVKAFAYDFNDKFINNSHGGGDANAIVGIRGRLDDPNTYGTRADCKIDAGGAVFTQAMTAAQANALLEWLEQLLWAVGSTDGNGVVLMTNEVVMRRLNFALRSLGAGAGLDITRDEYDREITTYRMAKIIDVGYKADQATRIITTTEAATGVNGSSTYTSIYAVKTGLDYLYGWQFEPLNVQDLGLINNGVTYRTFIDWTGGLVMPNTRAIARLYDIKIS